MHIVVSQGAYIMSLGCTIANIEVLGMEELDRVEKAIKQRRQKLANGPVSTVVERRNYRNGVLQLERRAYRRKDGGQTERGPYWYFHFREGGRQRTKYLGQTDNPEKKVDEVLGGE
jgi:hypothetical protein